MSKRPREEDTDLAASDSKSARLGLETAGPGGDLEIARPLHVHAYVVLDLNEPDASETFLFESRNRQREQEVFKIMKGAVKDLPPHRLDYLLRWLVGELDDEDIPAEIEEITDYYNNIKSRLGEWRLLQDSCSHLPVKSLTMIRYTSVVSV